MASALLTQLQYETEDAREVQGACDRVISSGTDVGVELRMAETVCAQLWQYRHSCFHPPDGLRKAVLEENCRDISLSELAPDEAQRQRIQKNSLISVLLPPLFHRAKANHRHDESQIAEAFPTKSSKIEQHKGRLNAEAPCRTSH